MQRVRLHKYYGGQTRLRQSSLLRYISYGRTRTARQARRQVMSEDAHESPEPKYPYEPLPDPPALMKPMERTIIVVLQYNEKASPAYHGTRYIVYFTSQEELIEYRAKMEADPDCRETIYAANVTLEEGQRMVHEVLTLEKILDIATHEGGGNPQIAMMHAMTLIASAGLKLTGVQKLHVLARLS